MADFPARVRVRERVLAWADPEHVHAELFAQLPTTVWLDSGPDATRGISVLAAPRRTVVVRDPAEALQRLARLLEQAPRVEPGSTPTPLGWVGWIGYAAGASELHVDVHVGSTAAMALGFVDRAVVFDHAERRVRLVALDAPDVTAWMERMSTAVARLGEPVDAAPFPALGAPVLWRHDREAYLERIRECQRLIRDGDVYQVCLSNEAVVAGEFDAVAVHARLRRGSPTHHGALFRHDGVALVCGSPEGFLAVDAGRRVTTRPMKGTRGRDAIPEADAALAAELLASEKERAENLMIVDLMRNDLGRVAEVGTVEVTGLFEVERYATVHQLVSTVEAALARSTTVVDLLRATLPPGSMTGAPKRRAVEIIDGLEGGARGAFSGVFGRFSLDGTVDLAVVIRSIEITGTAATIGVGGGITALSDPDEEYLETMLKAGSMLAALGARDD